MGRLTLAVCLTAAALSGCVSVKPAMPGANQGGANAPQPPVATSAAPEPQPAEGAAATPDRPVIEAPGSEPVAASRPRVKTPTSPPIKSNPRPANQVATQAPDKPPAPTPLDLTSLEQRLRDTRAIGVLTKLSLKNQVDDLLDQFRSFYRGEGKLSLDELHERYNLLLLKVLTLLQDGDAQLAQAISSSREAIWAILSDRDKFAKI